MTLDGAGDIKFFHTGSKPLHKAVIQYIEDARRVAAARLKKNNESATPMRKSVEREDTNKITEVSTGGVEQKELNEDTADKANGVM